MMIIRLFIYIFLSVGLAFSASTKEENASVFWPSQIEQIEPSAQPQGWLKNHEKLGGHTIKRHVKRSESYLKKRIKGDINEASSFINEAVAEQVISQALHQNRKKISHWINNQQSGDRLVFDVQTKKPTGYGIRKGESKLSKRYGARIVLQYSQSKGRFILTAYPHKRKPKK